MGAGRLLMPQWLVSHPSAHGQHKPDSGGSERQKQKEGVTFGGRIGGRWIVRMDIINICCINVWKIQIIKNVILLRATHSLSHPPITLFYALCCMYNVWEECSYRLCSLFFHLFFLCTASLVPKTTWKDAKFSALIESNVKAGWAPAPLAM